MLEKAQRKLKDFKNLEKIHESVDTIIYRAIDIDLRPVVLKGLKKDYPSPKDTQRIKREYEILQKLNHDNIIKIYDYLKIDGNYFLCMEDIRGESLDKYLIRKQFFSIREFLQIAIQITKALQAIQQKEIIHKDIKPHNIVYNQTNGKVKIIDFNSASILAREEPDLKIRLFEGTIEYVSPEQTGRMNRSLDYRTDFYSLGITFFQMLTGKVPFSGKNPLEIVHNHIARIAPYLSNINPQIPTFLSGIVAKLLEKMPENRYQSAMGLLYDLELALESSTRGERDTRGVIGSRDVSLKFHIPAKLYGREKELKKLESYVVNFLQKQGSDSVLLLKGEEGSGRSKFVQEISNFLISNGLYFFYTKAHQDGRKFSYHLIDQIVKELIEYSSFSEDEKMLELWRLEMERKFSGNIPELAKNLYSFQLIFKDTPINPDSPKENLTELFLHFFVLIKKFRIKALIQIDNFWDIDEESLDIIEKILSFSKYNHILFIFSYNQNSREKEELFSNFFARMRAKKLSFPEISFGPLDTISIQQLLADTLKCPKELTKELAEVIRSKTNGNSFYIHEFLNLVYRKGYIEPPLSDSTSWRWNLKMIKQEVVTQNVIEFLLEETKRYSEETLSILKTIACMGYGLSVENLAEFFKITDLQLLEFLKEPINREIIIISEHEINYSNDKIRQSILNSMDQNERKRIQYNIGKLLLSSKPDSMQLQGQEFISLKNLNSTIQSITSEEELLKILQLNWKFLNEDKSDRSDKNSIYKSSLDILQHDCVNLSKISSEIIYKVIQESVSILLKEESYKDIESILFKYIHYFKDDSNLRLELQILLNYAYIGMEQFPNAIQNIIRLLDELEPNVFQKESIRNFKNEIMEDLKAKIDTVTSEKTFSIDRVFVFLVQACIASLGYSSELYFQFLVFLYRKSKSSPSLNSILLFVFSRIYNLEEFEEPDLEILEHLPPDISAFFNYLLSTYVYSIQLHLIESLEQYSWIQESRYHQLQPRIRMISEINAFMIQFLSRDNLYSILESDFFQKDMKHLNSDVSLIYDKWKRNLSTLAGRSQENLWERANAQDISILEYWEKEENVLFLFYYYLADMFMWSLQGYHLEVYNLGKKLDAYNRNYVFTPLQLEYYFLYGMSIFHLFNSANEEFRQIYKSLARKISDQVEYLFGKYVENCSTKIYILKAELHRIYEEKFTAIDYYGKALEASKKFEFRLEEAIADELAGKFWLEHKHSKYAEMHIIQSIQKYSNYGCVIKLEQLKNQYPKFYGKNLERSGTQFSTRSSAFYNSGLSSGNFLKTIDSASVYKSMNLKVDEKNINEFIKKLNEILIENAGANRGVIILKDSLSQSLIVYSDYSLNYSNPSEEHSIQYLSNFKNIQKNIVNSAERTGKFILVKDATQDPRFSSDEYIRRTQVKSILCLPIIWENEFIGLVYLENNLSVGVFTEDRIEALNLLISKIAIPVKDMLKSKLKLSYGSQKSEFSQLLSSPELEVIYSGGHINKIFSILSIGIKSLQDFRVGTQGEFVNSKIQFREEMERILQDFKCFKEKLDIDQIRIYLDSPILETIQKAQSILDAFSNKKDEFCISIGVYEDESICTIVNQTKISSEIVLSNGKKYSDIMLKIANFFRGGIYLFDENVFDRFDLIKFNIRRIGRFKFSDKQGYICEIFITDNPIVQDTSILSDFSEAMEKFWQKEFAESILLFKSLLARNPNDSTVSIFLTLSQKYAADPRLHSLKEWDLEDLFYLEKIYLQ